MTACFPAVLTVSPIRNESGKILALSVIARDITARKKAETELRRANADLEQFAYSASHDLQEPLRTIKIYSELLADVSAAVEGEPRSSSITCRRRHAHGNAGADLLAYTQVTRLEAPVSEVDTNEALAEVIANLRGAITESRATVTFETAASMRTQDASAAAFAEPDRKRDQVQKRGSPAGSTYRR